MFTVEVANNSRTYQTAHEGDNADRAIYFFIGAIDGIKPADSVRIVADGTVMARKTPKGYFICEEWR